MNGTADPSYKIERARRKLKARLQSEGRQVTPDALLEQKEKIRSQFARGSIARVPLRDKISLFDENQNPAEISRRIRDIVNRLIDVK